MHLVTLDYETFWSSTHTLKKMSPIAYAMHPDTELISCSVKVNNEPTVCVFGEDDIRHLLAQANLSNGMTIGHNMSAFDSMLLAWRLGIRPKMWGCTLAMARPIHAKTVGLSLGALVEHYGIGVKDNSALLNTRGKHLADFTQAELDAMRRYNIADTDQCFELFKRLKPHYTADELWHIDANIRMLVEPKFELDTPLLEQALIDERERKRQDMLRLAALLKIDGGDKEETLETVRSQMASSAKFSQVLEVRGVEVPLKRSKTDPRKKIPAIAKTDEAMQELLEHDDEIVAAAAQARLSVKSTQLETRIQSFLDTYQAVGVLPVPAHYCGADTTGRDSGWLYNMLNLPRINPDKPKISDALRTSARAPKGMKVIVADLSGIELRVNHTLWQVRRSMDMWAAKADADLYRSTASRMYTITEAEVQKPQRQFAKVLELACGFQQGGKTFRNTARVQGGLNLSLEEAASGVSTWRSLYPEIADRQTGGWARCQASLRDIMLGRSEPIDPWGLCWTEKDAIILPSGRRIRYPDLREEWTTQYNEVDGELVEEKKRTWMYAHGRHKAYIYGGKMDENIVQALARDVIFPMAIEFYKRTGLRPQHKVYDELVYVVPENRAEELLSELQSIMRAGAPWWPELVTWSEGDVADSYGEAK